MTPGAWFCRDGTRYFPGQRWVSISLRSLHLVGVAGMGAGILADGLDPGMRQMYVLLTIVSGFAMTLIFAWSEGRWLLQLCGQSVLVKLALVAAIPIWPAAAVELFIAIILISGFTSHAPARLRHFEPIRWCAGSGERPVSASGGKRGNNRGADGAGGAES